MSEEKPLPSVSIRDVARRARVAPSTVSAALSGGGGVSVASRDRIRRIAMEMNYRPRLAAQLLRARRTGYIGLVLDTWSQVDPNNSAMRDHSYAITAFLQACREQGIGQHIELLHPSGAETPNTSKLLNGGLVDGVIVRGENQSPLRRRLMEDSSAKWVSFDEPAPHCVLSAMDEGVEQGIQHLAALGHRRIALARGSLEHLTHRMIQEGFDAAVKRYGLTCRPEWIGEFPGDATQELVRKQAQWVGRLLEQPERPTAILCGGSSLASASIYAAHQRGLVVPRDLSLIAVSYTHIANKILPMPTLLEADVLGMMRDAVAMLATLCAEREVEQPVRRFVPKLVFAETTAACPQVG